MICFFNLIYDMYIIFQTHANVARFD